MTSRGCRTGFSLASSFSLRKRRDSESGSVGERRGFLNLHGVLLTRRVFFTVDPLFCVGYRRGQGLVKSMGQVLQLVVEPLATILLLLAKNLQFLG